VVSGGKKKDKDSKRRLTKADIGQPKNFRHVQHVGWDPNKGFAVDNVADPQLKMFFDKVYIWECNEVFSYKMCWELFSLFIDNTLTGACDPLLVTCIKNDVL